MSSFGQQPEPHRHGEATGRKAGVVIASNRAAAGIYRDETGPVIIDWLTEHGFETFPAMVVPGRRTRGSRAPRPADPAARRRSSPAAEPGSAPMTSPPK